MTWTTRPKKPTSLILIGFTWWEPTVVSPIVQKWARMGSSFGTLDAARNAADYLGKLGTTPAEIRRACLAKRDAASGVAS